MFRYFTIGLVILLSGCSTLGLGESPTEKAKTPSQHLLALEVQYNGIFSLLADYEDLPRCSITESKVCSEQTVVNKMRAVNTSFDATSKAAWAVIRTLSSNMDAQDAAVHGVVLIITEARGLYDSAKDVISLAKTGAK